MESECSRVAGFVMRHCCEEPSNFRSVESLPAFLSRCGIVAIEEVDTRAITRKLRDSGAQIVLLSTLRSGSGIWLCNGPGVPPSVGTIWVPN